MKIKRRTLVLWKKRILWFFGIALFLYACNFYFRTPYFAITQYELIGIPDAYRDSMQSGLHVIDKQTRYKFLPSNKIFTYNRKAIVTLITGALPNTEKVSIRSKGLHTLEITATNYTPLFRVGETQAVTKDGVLYTELNDINNLTELSVASSATRDVIKDGVTSLHLTKLDGAKLLAMSSLVQKVNSVIFIVSKITVDVFGDISLYNEKGTSKIMFNEDADMNKVWSNLVSAIDTEPLKSKLTKNKDKLEYLDTRFGNKVFYKFTGDTTGGKFTNGKNTAIIESHEATSTATTTLPR